MTTMEFKAYYTIAQNYEYTINNKERKSVAQQALWLPCK